MFLITRTSTSLSLTLMKMKNKVPFNFRTFDIGYTFCVKKKKPTDSAKTCSWHAVKSNCSARNCPSWLGPLPPVESIKRLIEYFCEFLSDDILESIVMQSNLYAVQEDPSKPLGLTKNELECFLGTLFAMSLVKLSNSCLYWSSLLQCPLVCETMTRNRWEEIKAHLHCNDNSNLSSREEDKYDKLFKVRPLITHLQKKFREIPMPQMLCVDEQMVPYKGRSRLKQYMPSKPYKYGY